MTLDKVAEQRFEHKCRRASLSGWRSRRLLLAAVLGSVIVHLLPIGLVLFLPRAVPEKAGPESRGEVELLMVEQKGGAPSQAARAPDSPAKPEAAKPDAARSAATEAQQTDVPPAEKTDAPLPATDDAGEAVPLPHSPGKAEAPHAPPAPEAPPNPPPAARAPVFDFAGTDSDTNAHIISGNILPAMPDDRFRNRPPPYPLDAAMRGEAGAVLVIIHVSAYGVATGADVAESSGSASLDRAAVAAVRKWHFHPAMKEGLAVPFDMPFRFVFSTD